MPLNQSVYIQKEDEERIGQFSIFFSVCILQGIYCASSQFFSSFLLPQWGHVPHVKQNVAAKTEHYCVANLHTYFKATSLN